jgi:lipoyl(octanoyl) transferase
MSREARSDPPTLTARWLGRVGYAEGLELQRLLVEQRRRDEIGDSLLLLEHPPVVTLGRLAQWQHVLSSRSELEQRGIEIHECGRGGDVTYHGPGQLVGYPIVQLGLARRDAHRYLRDLEEGLLQGVRSYGIQARRIDGLTGIWVGDEKLAAIGVRLSSGWITSHGFALNVGADMSGFDEIVPCGIADRGVTSLARLLDAEPPMAEVAGRVARALAPVLDRRLIDETAGALVAAGAGS